MGFSRNRQDLGTAQDVQRVEICQQLVFNLFLNLSYLIDPDVVYWWYRFTVLAFFTLHV
jgi:hypothetical protein